MSCVGSSDFGNVHASWIVGRAGVSRSDKKEVNGGMREKLRTKEGEG